MEPTASTVEDMEKMEIEEALSLLASTRERCSEMLQGTPRGHDLSLRCLEFLEKELSYIVACLTAMSLEHVNGETLEWAEKLTSTVSGDLSSALDEADPQRPYTLLRRAAQCFQRKDRQPNQLLSAVAELYRLAESPCRYNHLLTDVTIRGWCEAAGDYEDSGFNPVRFNWFEYRYYSFPYGTYLLALYMVMFPYGHKFEKDGLLVKWVCETGMIDRFMGSEEDVFFSKLVHRSVITHTADNSRHIEADEAGTWQWNVNHLDHQFYASRSAEIGYVYTSTTLNSIAAAAVADRSNEITRSQIQIARRLALYDHHPKILSLLQNLDLSQTRSLAVSGAVSIGSFPLEKFVNLVVLDVEGWENFKDEDLVRVCRSKMFFLVYLSIRNTQVTKLPPEIKELYSLQVLDASNTQVTELPMDIMELRLRRLDLRGTPIRQLTESKQILRLHSCLQTLLLGGEGMISSTETATRMPHDLWHFWYLCTLATVDLREQPASFTRALGDLHFLTVLAITWSFHQSSDIDYCEALLSSINRLSKLESLTIHCGLGCSMDFLDSLSRPYWVLKKFKVTLGRFACVPQLFHEFTGLSFVQITVCKLDAHDLKILRGLGVLKCLVLGLDFIPKEAIVINNEGFRALQRFSIYCPVPWLTFDTEAMPKLTYLQMEFHACPTYPVSVPMGISNLCNLAKVALWYNVRYANNSSIKRTVEAVKEEVAKCRNTMQMPSLFINGIEQGDVEEVDEETGSATGAPSGTCARSEDDVQDVKETTKA